MLYSSYTASKEVGLCESPKNCDEQDVVKDTVLSEETKCSEDTIEPVRLEETSDLQTGGSISDAKELQTEKPASTEEENMKANLISSDAAAAQKDLNVSDDHELEKTHLDESKNPVIVDVPISEPSVVDELVKPEGSSEEKPVDSQLVTESDSKCLDASPEITAEDNTQPKDESANEPEPSCSPEHNEKHAEDEDSHNFSSDFGIVDTSQFIMGDDVFNMNGIDGAAIVTDISTDIINGDEDMPPAPMVDNSSVLDDELAEALRLKQQAEKRS